MSGMFDTEEQAILDAVGINNGDTDQPGGETPASDAPGETKDESANPGSEAAKDAAQDDKQPEQPKTDPAEPAQPHGDVRAALRASRRSEKRAQEEIERLRQENEALKQGKAPVNTQITDEDLAQLEADFPLQAKIVRRQRELEQQLAQVKPPEPDPEFQPLSYDPAVQEVIDSVPDLLAWQYDPAAQDKFLRAIEYDKALQVDPDWKDKSFTERFAEAASRTKKAFAQTATPTPAVTRQDPAAAIENAPVQGPKGISDFRGGGPATPPKPRYADMSDEDIMASLRPE